MMKPDPRGGAGGMTGSRQDRPLAEVSPRSALALRQATARIHLEAERSGIIADIARKKVSRAGLALFLRNLLPAYESLEKGLARYAVTPGVREIARPELARAAALHHDIVRLAGPDWRTRLAVAPAAMRYAQRIAAAAQGDGALLIAHAYVRYLGDLSGGQILKHVIAETLDLEPGALHFYDFPQIADPAYFKQTYRAGFDRAMRAAVDPEAILAEAVAAFDFNIGISNEVQACAASSAFGR
jgi:heme oxygenase (biliverdin-producing, ferredoxin)